jgi:tRNA A-37 threonylcarbamoyl transferase component Bud32
MVVMEYIHPSETPHDSKNQVSDVVKQLHGSGFVFGDLCVANILFDDDKNVKFIDFDWAGRYDQNVTDEALSGCELSSQEGPYPVA